MRVASVDIGTNSVLLLVVELLPDGHMILEESCTITRLGQGVAQSGALAPEAVARTLACLGELGQRMDALGVERRGAVGTAALREAAGSEALLGQAAALLGCRVEVVSGEREAELVLGGVRGALGALPRGAVLVDVGGGSTELVRWDGQRADALRSLPLGAVRLTERFLAHDPPQTEELRRLTAHCRERLAGLPAALLGRPPLLVGIAGTVTTLATLELGLERHDTERVNGLTLSLEQIAALCRRLAALPLAARRLLPGLEPARADVIVAGALIVETVLRTLGSAGLQVCDRGLRWGLLWELARQRTIPG